MIKREPEDWAFPCQELDRGTTMASSEGMSIREYTAIKIMAAIIVHGSPINKDAAVRNAIEYTDALMRELFK